VNPSGTHTVRHEKRKKSFVHSFVPFSFAVIKSESEASLSSQMRANNTAAMLIHGVDLASEVSFGCGDICTSFHNACQEVSLLTSCLQRPCYILLKSLVRYQTETIE
jgi:hypothetical protein